MNEVLARLRRGIKKPPKVIVKRVAQEINSYLERYSAPKRAKQLTLEKLLKNTSVNNLTDLWLNLGKGNYFSIVSKTDSVVFASICPGEEQVILAKAQLALEHQVDLLGSGPISLGESINWHLDYKTQISWPLKYIRDIDYNNPDRPSDVKFPWEVSRLQWLIPAGQAYLLTQDEQYAQAAKEILLSWIENNPYAYSINWACTMEVALRILSWTWFFHVFKDSQSWQDKNFQEQFLKTLYLHADFTERNLEFSDINGNHYTADAAGLVFAGLFFGDNLTAQRWHQKGWDILCQELPRQVFNDGVDFEASVPYHRLVLELFFLPACYRESLGFSTPSNYKDKIIRMAEFCEAYTQPDGLVPLWGDADDARALPFGYQPINNHDYLCNLVGFKWGIASLLNVGTLSYAELYWTFGSEAVCFAQEKQTPFIRKSCAYSDGGFYIMRNSTDHVFIDCGPLGLAGRGGHGHNDCLSFEAVLDGVKLISDCGAYVYTASYKDRNLFRSTAYHNTPCIDNQEINRFIKWDYLWTLHNDAQPVVEHWSISEKEDSFCGSHTGYQRLADPVIPKRTIRLNHYQHSLTIQDEIICNSIHNVVIPLHLAPNVQVTVLNDNELLLQAGHKSFKVEWHGTEQWVVTIEEARISASYGTLEQSQKVVWTAVVQKNAMLSVTISSGRC